MKKQLKRNLTRQTSLLVSLLTSGVALTQQATGAILLQETFETDGEGTRYTTAGSFTDGADDYFTRTDGTTEASGIPAYDGIGGSYFFAIEDSETTDNLSDVCQILFESIDISTTTLVQFSLEAAAGTTNAFDLAEDYFKLEYRVDDSIWFPAIAFYNDGATFNSMLRLDTDNNGVGDSTILTPTMQTFVSSDFNLSGTVLDVRIDTWMTGGSEALGFDNIQVTSIPEPASFTMILAALSGLYIFQVLLKRRNLESRA